MLCGQKLLQCHCAHFAATYKYRSTTATEMHVQKHSSLSLLINASTQFVGWDALDPASRALRLLIAANGTVDGLYPVRVQRIPPPAASYATGMARRDSADKMHVASSSLQAAGNLSILLEQSRSYVHDDGNGDAPEMADEHEETTAASLKMQQDDIKLTDNVASDAVNDTRHVPSEFLLSGHVSFAEEGDSFYEYLLKQWIIGGKHPKDDGLLQSYVAAMRGIRTWLLGQTAPTAHADASALKAAQRPDGSESQSSIVHEMGHLVCPTLSYPAA
jgi:Glycosyl hydrolase family 47